MTSKTGTVVLVAGLMVLAFVGGAGVFISKCSTLTKSEPDVIGGDSSVGGEPSHANAAAAAANLTKGVDSSRSQDKNLGAVNDLGNSSSLSAQALLRYLASPDFSTTTVEELRKTLAEMGIPTEIGKGGNPQTGERWELTSKDNRLNVASLAAIFDIQADGSVTPTMLRTELDGRNYSFAAVVSELQPSVSGAKLKPIVATSKSVRWEISDNFALSVVAMDEPTGPATPPLPRVVITRELRQD